MQVTVGYSFSDEISDQNFVPDDQSSPSHPNFPSDLLGFQYFLVTPVPGKKGGTITTDVFTTGCHESWYSVAKLLFTFDKVLWLRVEQQDQTLVHSSWWGPVLPWTGDDFCPQSAGTAVLHSWLPLLLNGGIAASKKNSVILVYQTSSETSIEKFKKFASVCMVTPSQHDFK